jgi:hypothetical protein
MALPGSRLLTALVSGIAVGASVFRKQMLTSTPLRLSGGAAGGMGATALEEFNRLDYRLARYNFWWAMYQNNAYDNVHPWAGTFKTEYALERNIRGCYNPCGRLGEFWATHIWTGKLDPLTQNGRVADSACPILTDNEALRPAIARLWRDSTWAVNKEVVARQGGIMGDTAIRVEDDPASGKVRLAAANPATVHWIRRDPQGNVDAYILAERRWDPRFDPRAQNPDQQRVVDYVEKVTRDPDGKTIHFETYLDGELYPWNGTAAEYDVAYGFVPFVFIPHTRPLADSYFGESEFQRALTKAVENDRVASNLHTQIRKASDPKFFIAGSQPPRDGTNPRIQGATPTAANPQPRDQELPFVYGGLGSTALPLLYSLDIQFTSMEIQFQLKNLELDYPELRFDSARASGDASAKALREVRKACEVKVHGRRVSYDDALVRAQQMAVAIGGMRGYDGYEGFSLESYADGKLDHTIGERSVFLMDPLDRIEESQAMMTCWQTAKTAGVPAVFFMEEAGYSAAQVERFKAALADEQARAMEQQKQMIAATAAAKPTPSGPGGNPQ